MSVRRGGRSSGRAAWLDALDPLVLMEGVASVGDEASSALARTLADRADLLLASGRRTDAVECAERAVEASGSLDEAERGSSNPEMADALTALANALAATTRHAEAARLSAHAVHLHARSASTGTEDARQRLAAALHEYARRLAETGRLRDALAASARSVRLREELAETAAGERHSTSLAASLTTHAELLAATGSTAEALANSVRSLRLYEGAAGTAAGIGEHGYVEALLVHANVLRDAGRRAKALEHTQRAVDFCTATADRYLHADDPDAALSADAIAWTQVRADAAGLALALTHHAKVLAESGQGSAALAASRYALEHWRRLDAAEPGSYQTGLADSRIVFASIRADSSAELESALAEARAALTVCRELSAREGEPFVGRMRAAAATVSTLLAALGRSDESAEARREAVTGSNRRPDRETPVGLDISFWNTVRATALRTGNQAAEGEALVSLGSAYWQAGRIEEAVHASEMAVSCSRKSGSQHTEALALFVLGICQMRAGRIETAIEADRQAAAVFRKLGNEASEGDALRNLSHALLEARRFEEAVEASSRAAELLHGQGEPLGEGIALDDLGIALTAIGRFEEATEALRKAAAAFRSIDNPECEGSALNSLGNALMRLDRFTEAADAFRDAVAVLRGTAERYREGVAWQGLSRARLKLGRPDEASTAAQHAAAIFRAIGERDAERAALRVLRDAARETEESRAAERSATSEDLERARVLAGLFAQAGGGALADPKVQRAAQAGLRACQRILDGLRDAGRLALATHLTLYDYVSSFGDSFDLAGSQGAVARVRADSDTDSRGRQSPFQVSPDTPARQALRELAILAAGTNPGNLGSWIRSTFTQTGEVTDQAICYILELLTTTEPHRMPADGDAGWVHAAVSTLIAAGTADDLASSRAAWRRILSGLGHPDQTVNRRRRELVFGLLLAQWGSVLLDWASAAARSFAGDGGGDLTDPKVRSAALAAVASIELGLTGLHQTGSLDEGSYLAVFERTMRFRDDLELVARMPGPTPTSPA